MTFKKLYVSVIISTVWGFGVPAVALSKAACELKQLVTGEEFETLQKKWEVYPLLPASQDKYGQIIVDDEISFYDTKSMTFKENAILRWRKSDGSFTIKDRSGSSDTPKLPGAKCQRDYVSVTSNKMSCQFDKNDSDGPLPKDLYPSDQQNEFLKANNLKWDAPQLIQMGPIRSYQTSVDQSVCKGLGDKSRIEFESWLMHKGDRTEMAYEVSVKVKDVGKCDERNEVFRSCLSNAGVDISNNRGTKTEAVYNFFQPEKP